MSTAQTDAPFGFICVRGNPSMILRFRHPAADTDPIGIGDVVKEKTSSSSDGKEKYVEAVAAKTDEGTVGVVVDIEPNRDNLFQNYSPGSADRDVYVQTDPHAEYIVQADGAASAADIGKLVPIIPTGADSTLEISQMEIDISEAATSAAASLWFRILGLARRPDNTLGSGNVVRVTWNGGIMGLATEASGIDGA